MGLLIGFLFLVLTILTTCTEGNSICQTQTCISVADEISGFLDPTADPCVDFFQFACGGFYNSANEGDNPLNDAGQEMKNRLERLITTKKPREGDFVVDQKVRDFHRACEKFRTTLGSHQQ